MIIFNFINKNEKLINNILYNLDINLKLLKEKLAEYLVDTTDLKTNSSERAFKKIKKYMKIKKS